jgi:hypothetical protein
VGARRRTGIEWVDATAASMAFDGEFDLAVMTGHAFQLLVGDDELRASVTAIRRALAHGGRFVFEAHYGGWSREPLDPASPEIITVARVERLWGRASRAVGRGSERGTA